MLKKTDSIKKIFFVATILFFPIHMLPLLFPDNMYDSLSEVKKLSGDWSDAAVKLLQSKDGKQFILKQIVDPGFDEQFLLLRDLVASEIGVVCGIPVNKVFLVPAEKSWDLKFYENRAATVHSLALGKNLEDKTPNFLGKNFIVQQKFFNPDSPWQKKCPIKKNEQGLTKKVIESMALDKDLSKIVAFDTSVCNSDRSLPNIFYDEKTGKFYGIDQAAAFNNKNLSHLAFNRINELIKENYFDTCKKEIISGLRLYRDTLVILHKTANPKLAAEIFENHSKYLLNKNSEFTKKIDRRVKFHKKAFKTNYEYTRELIFLLEQILENFR